MSCRCRSNRPGTLAPSPPPPLPLSLPLPLPLSLPLSPPAPVLLLLLLLLVVPLRLRLTRRAGSGGRALGGAAPVVELDRSRRDAADPVVTDRRRRGTAPYNVRTSNERVASMTLDAQPLGFATAPPPSANSAAAFIMRSDAERCMCSRKRSTAAAASLAAATVARRARTPCGVGEVPCGVSRAEALGTSSPSGCAEVVITMSLPSPVSAVAAATVAAAGAAPARYCTAPSEPKRREALRTVRVSECGAV